MADYFTQFSCVLDLRTAEAVDAALSLFEEMQSGEEPFDGFHPTVHPSAPGSLFICDVDGYGDSEQVIAFVLRCAERFDLTGLWGFCWALTCSRARIDGFGGRAQVIDLATRRSVGWIDCEHWVSQVIASGQVPAGGPLAGGQADGGVGG